MHHRSHATHSHAITCHHICISSASTHHRRHPLHLGSTRSTSSCPPTSLPAKFTVLNASVFIRVRGGKSLVIANWKRARAEAPSMIFECIFAPFWPRRWAVSLTNFETTFVCRSAFFWGTSTPTVASVGTQEARTQDQTASVQPARGREGRLPARCQGAVSRVASTRRSTRTRSVMIRTQEAVAHLITHRPLSFQKDSPPWSCLLKNN